MFQEDILHIPITLTIPLFLESFLKGSNINKSLLLWRLVQWIMILFSSPWVRKPVSDLVLFAKKIWYFQNAWGVIKQFQFDKLLDFKQLKLFTQWD